MRSSNSRIKSPRGSPGAIGGRKARAIRPGRLTKLRRLVERGDPRLVGEAAAWRDAGTLRKYDDRAAFSRGKPRRAHHAAQRSGAAAPIDRDRPGPQRVPAIERDKQQFAFDDDGE